jgi:hypothetical protein
MHPTQAVWRHASNSAPAFTDTESLATGLLKGALGCATLKKTYQFAAAHWHGAFPRLCGYS